MSMDLYRFFDATDRLLYLGISLSAAQRAAEHRREKPWWPDVARMEVQHLDCDRMGALEAEKAAIIRERPIHNIMHNDGPNTMDELTPTGAADGLVGMWVLTPDPDDGFPLMDYQGFVHDRIDDLFLVSWFSWLSGDETERVLLTLDEMRAFQFYPTKEQFEHGVDRGDRARDRQYAERSKAS